MALKTLQTILICSALSLNLNCSLLGSTSSMKYPLAEEKYCHGRKVHPEEMTIEEKTVLPNEVFERDVDGDGYKDRISLIDKPRLKNGYKERSVYLQEGTPKGFKSPKKVDCVVDYKEPKR